MTDVAASPDLLHGVPAVAAFLGLRERQTRHKIEKGIIPTFKIGGTVCARRSTLAGWLEDQEWPFTPVPVSIPASTATSPAPTYPDIAASVAAALASGSDGDLALSVVRTDGTITLTAWRPGRPVEIGTGATVEAAWLARRSVGGKQAGGGRGRPRRS